MTDPRSSNPIPQPGVGATSITAEPLRREATALADKIDHQISGTETWRVAREDGSFCMEFDAREYLNPERECREWLAERRKARPGWIENNGYGAVQSVEYTATAELALEAAVLLRRVADTGQDADLPVVAPDALREGGGVYFASKVKHAPRWQALRASGVPTVSTWIDEAGEGQTADYAELSERSLMEIAKATAVLLYCELGEILKGALVEVGAALMNGTPVLCVGNCDNLSRVFRKHPQWLEFETVDAALSAVSDLHNQEDSANGAPDPSSIWDNLELHFLPDFPPIDDDPRFPDPFDRGC